LVEVRRFGTAALTYIGFVVYGSLVPLAWHYRPLAEAWAAFLQIPYLELGMESRADWVANILLYLPLGFFATGWIAAHLRAVPASILVFSLCALLAMAVEFAQLFFPPRTVSLNDIVAEWLGAGLGIALWHFAGERFLGLWNEVQHGGRHGARALIALYTAAYLAFGLFPYDFLVSATELAQKLGSPNSAFFFTKSCGGALSCGTKVLSEVLTAAPLGAFLGMVAASGRQPSLAGAFGWGVLFGVAIEGLQTFLASGVSQGASILTRGMGMALGLAVYRFFRKEWLLEYRAQIKIVALSALPLYAVSLLAMVGFFTSELESRWVASAKLREVRFLPFYYHYFTSETQAMYSLLVHAGAYAPIGLIVWILRNGQGGRTALWLSALAAMFTAASMETLKLFLDGKKPDPTNALIAAAAAALACFAATRLAHWPAENLINGKTAQLQALPRQKLARTSSPKRITLLFMLVIALAISLLTLHRDASAAPDAPEAAREPSQLLDGLAMRD
jgi:VanZ family protein